MFEYPSKKNNLPSENFSCLKSGEFRVVVRSSNMRTLPEVSSFDHDQNYTRNRSFDPSIFHFPFNNGYHHSVLNIDLTFNLDPFLPGFNPRNLQKQIQTYSPNEPFFEYRKTHNNNFSFLENEEIFSEKSFDYESSKRKKDISKLKKKMSINKKQDSFYLEKFENKKKECNHKVEKLSSIIFKIKKNWEINSPKFKQVFSKIVNNENENKKLMKPSFCYRKTDLSFKRTWFRYRRETIN